MEGRMDGRKEVGRDEGWYVVGIKTEYLNPSSDSLVRLTLTSYLTSLNLILFIWTWDSTFQGDCGH